MESILYLLDLVLGGSGALLTSLVEQGLVQWSLDGGALQFLVEGKECRPDSCPGSQFTQIAAAWANIGYVTHSDVLHYITTTKFGLWAPLLYVCAALGALVGVAINMPMRNYMWFFLGPAIYGFLVGTTTQVEGVNWVVANKSQDMTEVWRNAEVGLMNTDAVNRQALSVDGKNGPVGSYEVAMPMVFLDELFSATTNILIEWLGIYRHEGEGASNSNLAAREGQAEGPWYLLSSLKWGMVENIVGVNARNPDFRDAFITFLGSECGDEFRKGIDSGKYISAGAPYGEEKVYSVIIDKTSPGLVGPVEPGERYRDFIMPLNNSAIPTPRSLIKIFQEGTSPGEFGQFSQLYAERKLLKEGRYQGIVCSEYLFAIIQQIRFEAGYWYWQLVRSAPNGLTRQQFLRTLFYGWDIRGEQGGQYASPDEMNAFVKHLIMTYMLRNEMLFAPQITEMDQRFAPSEQSRQYSESQVRSLGSKSKYQELYNWAVLMPHMQGILVYFLVIAYPFAAMVMVLPGYYKTFFTWISFFAWVKLWDLGFAIVMVLERSVWAMIGNNSNMARTANTLINTAELVGGVGVGCSDGAGASGSASKLSQLCPVPDVCSLGEGTLDAERCSGPGQNQTEPNAWRLLDTLLTLGAGADLDLANGYYVYIMAALYFAVPAVTGQIVLGAKAGAASMLNSAIGGVAGEAGKAASMGYQHQQAAFATSNAGSMGQAAYAKGMREAVDPKAGNPQSFAQRAFEFDQKGLEQQYLGANAGRQRAGLQNRAGVIGANADAFTAGAGFLKGGVSTLQGVGNSLDQAINPGSSGGSNGGGRQPGSKYGPLAIGGVAGLTSEGLSAGIYAENAKKHDASALAASEAARLGGEETAANLRQAGYQQYGGNFNRGAEQHAAMVSWEARNRFAAKASATGGVVASINSGAFSPGQKPQDGRGMGIFGELDGYTVSGGSAVRADNAASSSLEYANGGFLSTVGAMQQAHNKDFGGGENTSMYGRYYQQPTLQQVGSVSVQDAAQVANPLNIGTHLRPKYKDE
jgi:hypothetical protein